jgi:hypothetical protein
MTDEQDTRPRAADLEQAIKHGVAKLIGRRIRALEVEVIDSRVVIRGRVASFYLKQLALEAALAVIHPGGTDRTELDVQIAVAPLMSDAEVV